MKLETQRLILRDIADEDLDNVYRGLSDPEVIRYYGISYGTREETRTQMKWFRELREKETGIWWAICLKPEIQFIGAIGFNNLQKEHKKAEIGFWLYPAHWGNGYIREIVPTALKYAFDELGLHRVEGYVESHNSASKNALMKLGFRHEGTLRDCEIKDGGYVDLEIYAIIDSERNAGD